MKTYKIERSATETATVYTIGFGEPATNAEIVQEVSQHLKDEPPHGGGLLLISGPASLPVAFVLCHAVAHKYAAIGVYDPKLLGFVVAVSHDPRFKVGDLITKW